MVYIRICILFLLIFKGVKDNIMLISDYIAKLEKEKEELIQQVTELKVQLQNSLVSR